MGRLMSSPVLVMLAVLVCSLTTQAAVSRHLSPAHSDAVRIVFTGNDGNVYMMDANGKNRTQVTVHAGNGTTYPWYAWSPDHQYLLLLRNNNYVTEDILVLNRNGSLRSTLATGLKTGSFFPTWAVDGDVIAYGAGTKYDAAAKRCGVCSTVTVNRIDLTGAKSPLWHYEEQGGCGGGRGPNAAAILYNNELPGYTTSALTWSLRQHYAIYDTSCNGYLSYTDWKTGKTENFSSDTKEAVLDPTGSLVAVATSSGIKVYNDQGSSVLSVVGAFPTWTADGRYLYFEQYSRNGTCTLFRAEVSRRDVSRLIPWQHAYAFGPLHLLPDGRSLIVSRIDAIDQVHARVSIQRLDAGQLTTLAHDAARPAI